MSKTNLQLVLDRAEKELSLFSPDRLSLCMDLDSLPDLNLERLLSFNIVDFSHDILGIVRHMDRSNWPGKLKGCFEPRCGRIQETKTV